MKRKRERERKGKKKKKPAQGRAGLQTAVALSSATARRSCYGNHCKRLNISRGHDCEEWVVRELH
jgi:hypothetical protein